MAAAKIWRNLENRYNFWYNHCKSIIFAYTRIFACSGFNGGVEFCFVPIDNGDPRWPPLKLDDILINLT